LPRNIQGKVIDFFNKFTNNPKSNGINLEPISKVLDKQLYSVRIDDTYRGIVYKDGINSIYHLLWIDHHDEAYEWARNKREISCGNSNMQIYDIGYYEKSGLTRKGFAKLFARISNNDLINLGVPLKHLALIRNIADENELKGIKEILPYDVYARLEWLSTGYHVDKILTDDKIIRGQLINFY
jgi:hypothetical protein